MTENKRREIFFSGTDYTFYFEIKDEEPIYFVEFVSFRIEMWDEEDEKPLYLKVGAMSNSNDNLTPNMDEAEKFITGSIKWDGCSHLYFPDYIHYCSSEDAANLGKLLSDLYKEAQQFLVTD
jgi:hypothetical protein